MRTGKNQPENKSNEGGNKKTEPVSNMKSISRRLQISTWNIAAINNNPFEYWITFKENPSYEELMVKIEKFLEDPGDKDVTVPTVFTQKMFDELDNRLTTTANWVSVKKYWDDDFSKRTIVNGFMKDPTLGSKRLASMPDRITNTMNTDDGKTFFRPTVINMYEDDLGTQDKWWSAWEKFMFETSMKIKNREGIVEDKMPFELLQPISKKKYPAITTEEERDSLPLQTLCGAIFDAILVHMMNTLSEPSVWQELKRTMVKNLNKQKVPRTLDILEKVYGDSDVITLQEVSSSLIELARSREIGKKFHIIQPADLDAVRDQNSVICLKKTTFPLGDKSTEVTSFVENELGNANKKMLGKGDLLAISTESNAGEKYVIASFHGDTNGLATIPVTDALVKAMSSSQMKEIAPGYKLIFGLDANTYENGKPNEKQDVLEYGLSYVRNGLTSCWGDVPDRKNYTTYNARTYLQPQLNKACKQSEKREKGDVNPKDFILFPQNTFNVIQTFKDNTGKKAYIEDMAFPTLEFPSDHGIVTTILEPKEN